MIEYESEYQRPEKCYCNATDFPPCSFCENANYCENCDSQTWDDICQECGRIINEENEISDEEYKNELLDMIGQKNCTIEKLKKNKHELKNGEKINKKNIQEINDLKAQLQKKEEENLYLSELIKINEKEKNEIKLFNEKGFTTELKEKIDEKERFKILEID